MSDEVTSRNITAKIEAVGDKLEKQIMDVFTEIGGQIEGRAVEYAPADLGGLRGSSTTRRFDDEKTVVVAFVAEYAEYVHDMTPKHAGEPRKGKNSKGKYWDNGQPKYLEQAFEEFKPAVEAALRQVKV